MSAPMDMVALAHSVCGIPPAEQKPAEVLRAELRGGIAVAQLQNAVFGWTIRHAMDIDVAAMRELLTVVGLREPEAPEWDDDARRVRQESKDIGEAMTRRGECDA